MSEPAYVCKNGVSVETVMRGDEPLVQFKNGTPVLTLELDDMVQIANRYATKKGGGEISKLLTKIDGFEQCQHENAALKEQLNLVRSEKDKATLECDSLGSMLKDMEAELERLQEIEALFAPKKDVPGSKAIDHDAETKKV